MRYNEEGEDWLRSDPGGLVFFLAQNLTPGDPILMKCWTSMRSSCPKAGRLFKRETYLMEAIICIPREAKYNSILGLKRNGKDSNSKLF